MNTNAESIRIKLCQPLLTGMATLSLAGSAAAQTVVVGTGNPDIDVPAVQAAVDQGGAVMLQGHFSFDRPPTKPTLFDAPLMATILVSHQVVISGTSDEQGGMTSIVAGTIPFYVEAPGARVEILGLRFIHPKFEAIDVSAVSGLVITSCKIEGVVPELGNFSNGIGIYTTVNPPTPPHPGKPELISGTLLIADNEIDVPGTSLGNRTGILIFSVGVPGAEANVYVSRNTITNSTEGAMAFYQVDGRVAVERNVMTTSTMLGTVNTNFGRGTAVMELIGTGSYLIAGNSVHSRWGAASGIRAQGRRAVWPVIDALVVDNEVDMEAPEGTVFDDNSLAIDVRGFAQGNVVANNRIRGRAGVALSVSSFTPGTGTAVPANNEFLFNRVDEFEASRVDVLVSEGVMNTLIVGQGTVEDHGFGTVVIPLPNHGGDHEEGRREQNERDR